MLLRRINDYEQSNVTSIPLFARCSGRRQVCSFRHSELKLPLDSLRQRHVIIWPQDWLEPSTVICEFQTDGSSPAARQESAKARVQYAWACCIPRFIGLNMTIDITTRTARATMARAIIHSGSSGFAFLVPLDAVHCFLAALRRGMMIIVRGGIKPGLG